MDGGKRNLNDYRFIQINKQRNREENTGDKETDHTDISMHNDFGALLRMCAEN